MATSHLEVGNPSQGPLDPAQVPYLASDLAGLPAAVLKAARALVASDGAAAVVLTGQEFRVLASDGASAALLGSALCLQELGAPGQALLAGKPVRVADTAADATWSRMPGQEQARSWLAVPLASEGKILGVLTWTALDPNRFGEEAVASAEGLARVTAPILRWAQLVDSVRRHVGTRTNSRAAGAADEDEPEVQLARIVGAAQELSGAQTSFIYLVDSETGKLRCAASMGDRCQALGSVDLCNDGSLSAWIVAPPSTHSSSPGARSDREVLEGLGIKGTLLLPLLSAGTPVGFLGVANRRDGAPFGEYATRLLTELAGGASHVVAQIGSREAFVAPVDYGLLVPVSTVPLGVLTSSGQISFANPALSELIARPGQPISDHNLAEFMGATDCRRFTATLEEVLATGEYRMMGLRFGAQGHRRSMQLSLASLRAFLARDGRVLAVLEDGAGARRLDEERARQLQELREKTEALAQLDLLRSRFMSDISQELRTPLAAIKLHVTLARIGRPERRSHYLQTIEQETHRLETMVENVLDVTRIDGNGLHIHAEWLEPTEIIGQVLQIYAEGAMQKGISLENATEGTLPRLWVDKNHTVQILANLFDNALKYTPAGGRVWIDARTNRTGAQPVLDISVGDTGSGIAEDEQEKIFQRFYRGSNNPRGTTGAGLGLSIIRELMAHLGGTVSVVSRPGEGSLFTLHFPLIQDAAQTTRA